MAKMFAKMLKGAPHTSPEDNAVSGAHVERISTHLKDLKSCRDAASMLGSPSTSLDERIRKHFERIEAFTHSVRKHEYTYRLGARSIKLTKPYVLVNPDSPVQIDMGSFRKIKRETRKIRAEVAKEYARQRHKRSGLLGWASETPARAALTVLST